MFIITFIKVMLSGGGEMKGEVINLPYRIRMGLIVLK
jgi:uncharacterized membrane protein YkvI